MSYKAKYVKPTKVRDLFVIGDVSVRISGDAVDEVMKKLDKAVESEVEEILKVLPRKEKGPNKGQLKRITIKKEDLVEPPSVV